MIGSWQMDTLGQLIGPLALKFLNTLLNLSNFPKIPYTQFAPLKIPILKIKSRITEKIMTQCLCPKHMYVWPLERDAPGKGMLTQSGEVVGCGAALENRLLFQACGYALFPGGLSIGLFISNPCLSAMYFLSASIYFLNANLYRRNSLWFRALFCQIKICSPREEMSGEFSTPETHLDLSWGAFWAKGSPMAVHEVGEHRGLESNVLFYK